MADSGYTAPADAKKAAKNPQAKKRDLATPRKLLNTAIEATNQNRIYQREDLKFAAGSPDNKYQWPEAIVRLREGDPNGARPVLTINKLPQHINQVANEQRQNRPSIKIIPVDDKADKDVAEVLTGIVRHIEYLSDAETAYATAGENQITIGEGYLRVLTDYTDSMSFEQDLYICAVKNSFSVYLDPVGLQKDATGRECEWGFIVEDLSEDEFERQYPQCEPVNWDLAGNGDDMKAWFPESHTVRVAEYFCFKYREVEIHLLPDGSVHEGALPDGVQALKSRKTTKKQLMWQKMTGLEVIEERELPGRYIPLIRMVGNEWWIDGKMVVAGLIRNAKDAQRMYNYWKSTECETLALAPKAPFVAAAEAIEDYEEQWQQSNIKNFAVLKYNSIGPDGETVLPKPERQIPPMPPVGIVNAALGAADDIKSATGQYDPSLGNNPQAKSGIALQREQRKTDVGIYHYIDNQGRAVKQLGRILVDIIPFYYDTRRVARIIGEDGKTDHVVLDPDSPQPVVEAGGEAGIDKIYNPSIGKYDVIVSVGPGFTSKRQEASALMSEVLQGNPQLMGVMGDLYFEMLDVPGGDKIAERLKKALPPGLAEPEEGDEAAPMVNTPQGPVPLPQAEQMIGQLMQGTAQMAEQLEQADVAKAQKDARDAENRAAELAIQADQVAVAMFEAETARYQAFGTLELKAAEVSLKADEIEIDESLARSQQAQRAHEVKSKTNGGSPARSTQ
jgi:hypothetical protein